MNQPAGLAVKICGVTSADAVESAIASRADYVGFVSFERSPRHVRLSQMKPLAKLARDVRRVVLLVDPSNAELDAACSAAAPFAIQLHGDETPARVDEVKRRLSEIEVWKALPVSTRADIANASDYPADRFLFDAKPPKDAQRPGGWGASFDWSLLTDAKIEKPWFLAGGLTPDNVSDALRATHAPGVDVSSGVERAPGVKDPDLISAFIANARAAAAQG